MNLEQAKHISQLASNAYVNSRHLVNTISLFEGMEDESTAAIIEKDRLRLEESIQKLIKVEHATQ